ncbi:MAG: hypothetical protein HOY79_16000 [Streptomyces sp.]|nr:hypothetical protein [Streptomyces sp.]
MRISEIHGENGRQPLRGPAHHMYMKSKCTVLQSALTAVVFALAPAAAAVTGGSSATIEAEKQLNVGSSALSTGVNWMFSDSGAQVPAPTNDTLAIDTRDLTGIASLSVEDPRCKPDQQVITCVDTDSTQSRSVLFTVRAAAGARPGDSGTIKYTLTADHATGATMHTKVVVGVPNLVVG